MPKFDFVDPRRLWVSYMLALSLLFSLITFSHFAEVVFGGDSARAVTDINMSGRQRMLSQRILYFARRHIETEYSDPEVEAALRDAYTVFINSHNTLTSQQERPLSEELKRIYFDDTGPRLDQDARAFATDTRRVLEAWKPDRLKAYERMAFLGPNILLQDLNKAVAAFEAEAKRINHTSKMLGHIGYALSALALLLVGFFIFRPAHRTIVQAMDDLEENNEQLKQQEAEAFAALEDSEDAWVEAENARRNSTALVDSTRDNVVELREELAMPLGAMEHLVKTFNLGALSTEQRQCLTDMSRLNVVAQTSVDEFAAKLQGTDQEKGARDKPFLPLELAKTATVAVHAMAPASHIEFQLEGDDGAEMKVSGQPVVTLRYMIDILRRLAIEEGYCRFKICLGANTVDTGTKVVFRVFASDAKHPEQREPGSGDARLEFEAMNVLENAVYRQESQEDGSVLFEFEWTAKSATVRSARKRKAKRKTA